MKNTKVIITSATVVVIFIIILIANHIYNENDYFTKWLVCEYKSQYKNYEEKLNFVFVSDVLYEFYREEYFTETEEHSLEELNDYFLEKKEKVKDLESSYFTYKVKRENEKINISTYINALNAIDFYNEYIEEKDLDFDDTIDEIKYDLENEYSCEIIKR